VSVRFESDHAFSLDVGAHVDGFQERRQTLREPGFA
jgi:hypothetical protein